MVLSLPRSWPAQVHQVLPCLDADGEYLHEKAAAPLLGGRPDAQIIERESCVELSRQLE